MLFSSPVFLFRFLPLLLLLYLVSPRSLRNLLLLVASLLFYAWGEQGYVVVLLASITVNYGLGLWLDRLPRGRIANAVLCLAVLVNLGLLGTFKYANFFADNLNRVLLRLQLGPIRLEPVHLPLGISFFTFQVLSYVIDVYRREVRALANPLDYALYIAFFPQSIAGPIVRYHEVAGQLLDRLVTRENFAEGVRRFILGLGKKMLLANTLAGPADLIFALRPDELTTPLAWLGVVCYALQIYFDFSGYSDMAIGLGLMFGFRFPENFNYPYIARSVTEFWRRWHISLSTWFRDYLYIPLGGNRCRPARLYANLLTVFFLCGLWHGASWHFLAWGLFHGVFLVLERLGLGKVLAAVGAPLAHLYTLLVVLAGWVLFRVEGLAQAPFFFRALAGGGVASSDAPPLGIYLTAEVALALAAGVVASIPVLPRLIDGRDRILAGCAARPRTALTMHYLSGLLDVAGCGLVLLASIMLLAAGTYNPFIYFRF
jgi:alginate O-acetyltransferase complex protein AlgI